MKSPLLTGTSGRRFRAGLFLLLALAVVSPLIGQGALADFPHLEVQGDLFNRTQLDSLQRDASQAQGTNVPTMFVVTTATVEQAANAQDYAQKLLTSSGIESDPGADDGMVVLMMYVMKEPDKSALVFAYGAHAFDGSSLSAAGVADIIAGRPSELMMHGDPFSAMTWAMRQIRHLGIFSPPPPRAITGMTRDAGLILTPIAGLALVASVAVLATQTRLTHRRRLWANAAVLGGSVALFVLAVWTHNRWAVWSALLMLGAVIAFAWLTTPRPPHVPKDWERIRPDIVACLGLIVLSLVINFHNVPISNFHRDETRWMSRAYYISALRDPFGPTWQDYVNTVDQPPLTPYLLGISLWLQEEPLDTVGTWDFSYDQAWFTATGGMPSDHLLHAARNTNAVIGALAVGAIYVIGRRMSNRVGGVIGGLYLALHPLAILLSTQALSDATLSLLLALIFVTGYAWAKHPTWSRALILGVLMGLGGADKLSPLLLAIGVGGIGAARMLLDRSERGRRLGLMLLLQPVFAGVTFLISYPFLWESPIRRTLALFEFRAQEMDNQNRLWPATIVSSPIEALGRFGHRLTYQESPTRVALQWAFDHLGIHQRAAGIDLVFAAIGVVMLVWSIGRTGLWTPRAFVAMLMMGEFAILALGMKAEFYRYHLPVVIVAAVLIAVATGQAWDTYHAWRASRRHPRELGRAR